MDNNPYYRNNIIGLTCLSEEYQSRLTGYYPADLFNTRWESERKLAEPQKLPDKPLPDIPDLPYGDGVNEYFAEVAQRFYDRYDLDNKIESLLSIKPSQRKTLEALIPEFVSKAVTGCWNKITASGKMTFLKEFEPGASIFDTESFVKGSICNSAIVAQAIGLDPQGEPALYMWLHDCFADPTQEYEPTKVSIGQNKLLVGHNFGFDRQKIKEFYTKKQSTNICICTMAMTQLIGGVDEKQRWLLNADPRKNYKASKIQKVGTALSLVAAYKFVTGRSLPDDAKELRNIFVKAETFQEFVDTRADILRYSMMDVIYNLVVFQKSYERFQSMANSKAILAGQCSVLDAIVPHIDYWDEWVERCDLKFEQVYGQIIDIAWDKIEELHKMWMKDPSIAEQPSLKKLDWSGSRPKGWRKNKPLPEDWVSEARWFVKLRRNTKIKSVEFQVCLQAQYKFEDEWYDVRFTQADKYHIEKKDKIIRLPNRKKPGENFGNILSADGAFLFKKGLLRSKLLSDDEFGKVFELFDMTTTYTGFRNRVVSQNKLRGLVAAEIKPAGTVSGRTVSSLYNTLPAHWDAPKIMSEIKMTSQCPEGWVFVGGDADSQEASIAAAMGDSYYGASGACPFSLSVVAGSKKDGTDYHSLTAKNITGKLEVDGDERFGAKGVNFGLIYGAGVKTTGKTISFGYDVDSKSALGMARKAVDGFKGKREFIIDSMFGREELPFTMYEGGIASDVFNKMTDMIRKSPPRGLFFNNEWPRALHPEHCGTDGSPPQLNYCIQASCSTYGFLSAWVISVLDEIERENIKARFSISIHDEIWFLCKEEDAEKLAYRIMICYARTWALLHFNLGIEDMPLVRAFPSSISIDKILRKSCDASTKTPTFDEYPPGREVTIYDFLGTKF